MKKKIGLLAVMVLLSFTVLAGKVKVKLKYSSIEREYSSYNMVDEMNFNYGEKKYWIQRQMDVYNAYTIHENDQKVGTFKLSANAKGFQWEMGMGNDTVHILFTDYNDPREIELRVNKKYAWYMANMEPDCNSIFDLYANKAAMQTYNRDKRIASAAAKKACSKTGWTIKMNSNKEIPLPVFMAYTFTSTMAITVRGNYSEY